MTEMATHGNSIDLQERCFSQHVSGSKAYMTQFDINRSCKRPPTICSPFCMPTETALDIIFAGFTTWLLTSGWLTAWPILAKRAWPKIRSESKRAITAEEHAAVIACEGNDERRAYYSELLLRNGRTAQTDGADLTAEDVDWTNGVLVYRRKKLGPFSEPARLTIGATLRSLLESLPRFGPLFPNITRTSAAHRSAEFRRRCRVAGVQGVSLHSLSPRLWRNARRLAGIHSAFRSGGPRSRKPCSS